MTSSKMAAINEYEVRALRQDELDAWFDHLEVRALADRRRRNSA